MGRPWAMLLLVVTRSLISALTVSLENFLHLMARNAQGIPMLKNSISILKQSALLSLPFVFFISF